MRYFFTYLLVVAPLVLLPFPSEQSTGAPASAPAAITVAYPEDGSLFPPDMEAPTVEWHDAADRAARWQVEIAFPDGSARIVVAAAGERMKVGAIDPRCVSPTNKLPTLTPQQAALRTWKPDAATWARVKEHSVDGPAIVTITGYDGDRAVSQGAVRIRTSRDPVGAPIFYRDVPLMPSELQKGVIKPLEPKLLPYLAWRLRYVDEPASRVVLEGIHTCANCHSFSKDGRTLGLDLDGPQNDKGLYAIVPVRQQMSIRNEDVISWKKFRNQMERGKRIGFMSQVSPDGRYVATTTEVQYYVANFTDYRFLQVFYPTRGILAWYDRAQGQVHALPGADDPRYVQANAVWSPDGQSLLFVRAPATESYPQGRKMAEFANDPNEVQIQYDIYRIPFHGGAGGTPEPVRGASRNGMSNSFPKVSPDGRWIVFVKSRNGQLMRPDGQLYIVPASGGEARRMRCNTALMNSWHSFSPNGRWMVFSSKSRSPYTQMFLTHIDENGNDSPPVLIENSTAANRAVNIPEFANIPKDGLLHIDAPAAEFYRLYDLAYELTEKGQTEAAIAEWQHALQVDPNDASARNNLGGILLRRGRLDAAEGEFRRALQAKPESVEARNNLGLLLLQRGRLAEAGQQFRASLEIDPESMEALVNLGGAYLMQRDYQGAVKVLREAMRLDPGRLPVLGNLAWLLATCPDQAARNGAEAVVLSERAAELSHRKDPIILDGLGAAYAEAGRFAEAARAADEALKLAEARKDGPMVEAVRGRVALYRAGRAYREKN
ncbi:tetratricopeptide repeat protein [uncultured Paludibaculum sp.]|uniref:tetratricopeptide repeat protein n=1 Tax=uncultured Paludibaculum sp. TaxID=1765020 RepID=UPI002AAAE911|nr:tetratricopeptide repeat protein [uncultured Paludibaculum sp.]